MPSQPALFENQPIRRIYDEATETWWFSVVDIVQVLTEQPSPLTARKYWNKLKQRLSEEGSQLVTNCHQLKMTAADGKQRLTDCAQPETVLRLVQSVPSPKAEPIKLWLAKVGHERIQEIADPALSIDRAREVYKKQGRSEKWITRRLTGQETRNKLTDYWAGHEVKPGQEFAILTNLIHEEWAGVSVKAHKDLKGLKTQNLRDHMTEAELIFTALAELSTREVAETAQAKGMPENETAARVGGRIAKRARIELESKTGRKVVTGENYLPPKQGAKVLKGWGTKLKPAPSWWTLLWGLWVARQERADKARPSIRATFAEKQQAFLEFVLSHYVAEGFEELDQEKLAPLLQLRYNAVSDAIMELGPPEEIVKMFTGFQRYLY